MNWALQRTLNSATFLDKENLDLFRKILDLEEIIVMGYIKEEEVKKNKEFSLVSTLFGMAHFYYTND